jgi:hypothetical protein
VSLDPDTAALAFNAIGAAIGGAIGGHVAATRAVRKGWAKLTEQVVFRLVRPEALNPMHNPKKAQV